MNKFFVIWRAIQRNSYIISQLKYQYLVVVNRLSYSFDTEGIYYSITITKI